MKTFGIVVSCIAAFMALIFALSLFGLGMDSFFAPKAEQIRRNTYENSSSYNVGMIRDLDEIQMKYMEANSAGKDALRAITLHRFAAYPVERMTPDQRNFYFQLKSNQQ